MKVLRLKHICAHLRYGCYVLPPLLKNFLEEAKTERDDCLVVQSEMYGEFVTIKLLEDI